MACLVPGCKSNYKWQAEFTTAFYFPKDHDLPEKSFRAIPPTRAHYDNNKQLEVSSNSFVYHNCQIM